jgi:hypothetical protein
MPRGRPATFRSTVDTIDVDGATFTTTVDAPGWSDWSFVSTVGVARVQQYEGAGEATVYVGCRVKLNDAWVPDDDLVGPVEIDRALDNPMATAKFGLMGPAYAPAATSAVWARTPVEIWRYMGRAAAVAEECIFAGYVLGCAVDEASPCVLRLDCGDRAAAAEAQELCVELDPLQGLTRGAIVREVLADVGVTEIVCPDGAVYDKGVQAIGERPWPWLAQFVEPEGWRMAYRPGSTTLEVWRPQLVAADEPAHATWTPSLWERITVTPPDPSPSRWVIRGTSALSVDEIGITTTTTETVISRTYSPARATQQQDSAGAITSTGLSALPAVERVVTRIVDEVAKRGTRLMHQFTTEWGWKNVAAAKYRTPNSEPDGPVGAGYYYVPALIDDQGRYVCWRQEKFVVVGQRFQQPTYDSDGDIVTFETRVLGWYRRLRAVKTASSSSLDVALTYVGDDDQSYAEVSAWSSAWGRAIEGFGLLERSLVGYDYAANEGPVVREVQDSYAYRPIGATTDSTAGDYVRFDGEGQTELTVSWRRWQRRTVDHLLSADYLERGVIETTEEYDHPRKADGEYAWGDHFSSWTEERFVVTDRRNTAYNLLGEDTFEEVVTDSEGTRPPRKIFGKLPLPRFRLSPWTSLVQAPIEQIVLDDVALALWGPSRETLDHPHILDNAEAVAVVNRRRERRLRHHYEVELPIQPVDLGDTVELRAPSVRVTHRCLVWGVRERYDGADASASYTLEAPLAAA